ncbi:MAG: Glycosyl transferase group 1 [Candidatus Giovannonibacteria bacterium GW2011_GWB1_46_20]|uniref:Glycosyl transferase group 1 n=2 Tax=Candidatus Giovannoniibacteriota TaxID=1752738 RepID=A0A0G1ING0_9BACT|nr:MAG: Glycosyl transferase group 1 [Parcubacteria group bacterium GW2011_GWC1_44_10]KKT60473.1 MAG: Glycosyl transferase group 1 [Candidatus Giovannonibacteria bacterium GW2011_GWA1_44_25]KKU30331.1 MAG: Glycosyl transferase group 1 [Candidatus Giovannonibacteria bacterium GW2011_GWB1_46_20]
MGGLIQFVIFLMSKSYNYAMRVLMISGDPGVLDPKSETGKRTEEYRQVFGTLDVLLCYGNIFRFISGFFRGLKLMRRRYDIITAQGVEHSLLAWIFSKLFYMPWQMQIHADIFSPYFVRSSASNKMRVLLAKFLIPRADCIRVVSERIKSSLTAYGVRHTAINVLPIFVDTEKIRTAPIKTDLHKKYPGRFIILMASRITREKNIGLAIEAMQGEKRRDSISPLGGGSQNPLLLIVGDGPEKQNLEFRIKNLELEENVKFAPYTEDLASYYKTCDLFLLTSNYEGYGRTLVEAAAVGAKIISSDVGIAPKILEPENIFKVGDKKDLADKLLVALAGPPRLASGEAGQVKPPRPISIQTKDEYLRLYKKSFEICQI